MSSTEPPEPNHLNEPGNAGGQPAGSPPPNRDQPPPAGDATQPPEQRTEPIGHPASGSAGALGSPGQPGSAEAPDPAAGTGTPATPVARRRRWPWIVGGVVAILVAMVIGSAITIGVLHHARGRFQHSAMGAPGGAHGQFWGGGRQGGPFSDNFGGHQGGHFGGHRGGPHGAGRGLGMLAGPALFGSVTSVNGTNLVVTPDGGQPVTLTTTDQTRVGGSQVRTLSDLKAGDRVVVRLTPDHAALGVFVVPATTRGTVTALSGTQATITEPDGLTQLVDTSALPTQPKVGDLVAVRGSASGATIKAQTLRELPKAS